MDMCRDWYISVEITNFRSLLKTWIQYNLHFAEQENYLGQQNDQIKVAHLYILTSQSERLYLGHTLYPNHLFISPSEHLYLGHTLYPDSHTSLSVCQGSIKKKIEKLRRWSSCSIKRPSKKTKTRSLSTATEAPEETWGLKTPERRRLKPIIASVFGQV